MVESESECTEAVTTETGAGWPSWVSGLRGRGGEDRMERMSRAPYMRGGGSVSVYIFQTHQTGHQKSVRFITVHDAGALNKEFCGGECYLEEIMMQAQT